MKASMLRGMALAVLMMGTAGAAEAPSSDDQRFSLRRGETLVQVLLRAGLPAGEAHEIAASLRGLVDVRDLKIGQDILIERRSAAPDQPATPHRIGFRPAIDRDVVIERVAAGAWAANVVPRKLTREIARGGGTITQSLARAAEQAGLPNDILIELIRQFSFDVDFQRDVQPGDRFDVLYERDRDEEGDIVRAGRLLAAELTLSGKALLLFRFEAPNQPPEFFTGAGASVRKALLKTPIDGARLTSSFGMRNHPILGFSRMHSGVDFGAPAGTRIHAAGDGVVERAGFEASGYGNVVRIRHTPEFTTLYAHMQQFGLGIRPGTRVRQGQVIGFVGSTGMSTGPHLHYEVHQRGKPINPTALRMPTGRTLTGPELRQFEAERARLLRQWDALPPPQSVLVATRPDDTSR